MRLLTLLVLLFLLVGGVCFAAALGQYLLDRWNGRQ